MVWVVFVNAMFSCLNLEPNEEFLSYNMLEVCNKIGHGLTDIISAWDEFKHVLHPDIYATVELQSLHHAWGLCQKIFKSLE